MEINTVGALGRKDETFQVGHGGLVRLSDVHQDIPKPLTA